MKLITYAKLLSKKHLHLKHNSIPQFTYPNAWTTCILNQSRKTHTSIQYKEMKIYFLDSIGCIDSMYPPLKLWQILKFLITQQLKIQRFKHPFITSFPHMNKIIKQYHKLTKHLWYRNKYKNTSYPLESHEEKFFSDSILLEIDDDDNDKFYKHYDHLFSDDISSSESNMISKHNQLSSIEAICNVIYALDKCIEERNYHEIQIENTRRIKERMSSKKMMFKRIPSLDNAEMFFFLGRKNTSLFSEYNSVSNRGECRSSQKRLTDWYLSKKGTNGFNSNSNNNVERLKLINKKYASCVKINENIKKDVSTNKGFKTVKSFYNVKQVKRKEEKSKIKIISKYIVNACDKNNNNSNSSRNSFNKHLRLLSYSLHQYHNNKYCKLNNNSYNNNNSHSNSKTFINSNISTQEHICMNKHERVNTTSPLKIISTTRVCAKPVITLRKQINSNKRIYLKGSLLDFSVFTK